MLTLRNKHPGTSSRRVFFPLFLSTLSTLPTLLAPAGCKIGDDKITGPPTLQQFLAGVDPDADGTADLLAPPDGGLAPIAPLSRFKLVFNRLLDGSKIETVMDGGVTAMTDVASIAWMNAPAGAPAITAATNYSPAGAIGSRTPGPSIRVQAQPGLPSAATLQIALTRAKITGKDGAPFEGPAMVSVETEPFAGAVDLPMQGGVPADAPVTITFNNNLGMGVADQVKVTMGGTAVDVDVKPDDMNTAVLGVLPKSGAWTPGATYTVEVGAGAADNFGVKLAEAVKTDFTVAAADTDGGEPEGDGGVADGGATDAQAADAQAADAATDK